MDDVIIVLLVCFAMFGLLLLFLGIRTGKKKKIVKKELEDLRNHVTNKPNKKETKLTNKITVKTEADFLGYKGSTPFIEFDENYQQMPLDRTTLTIPRENLTRMFPLAYLAGKLSVLEQGSKIGTVMIILFILIIISLGLTYFMSSNLSNQIKSVYDNSSSITSSIKSDLQNNIGLTQLIAQKLNITGNITTVGG